MGYPQEGALHGSCSGVGFFGVSTQRKPSPGVEKPVRRIVSLADFLNSRRYRPVAAVGHEDTLCILPRES